MCPKSLGTKAFTQKDEMNYKRVRCLHSNITFDLLFLLYRIPSSTSMTLLYIQIKKDTVLCDTVPTVRLRLKKIPPVKSKHALKFSQKPSINIATMCVKFLLHFGNFPGSKLDPDNGWNKVYCGFPQPLPTNGILLHI